MASEPCPYGLRLPKVSPVTAQALEALEARWAEMDTYDDRPLLQQLMERGFIARHSPEPWPRMPTQSTDQARNRLAQSFPEETIQRAKRPGSFTPFESKIELSPDSTLEDQVSRDRE